MRTLAGLKFKLENQRMVDEILNDGDRLVEPRSYLDLLPKGSPDYRALAVAIHNLFNSYRVPLSHVPQIVTVNLGVMNELVRDAMELIETDVIKAWLRFEPDEVMPPDLGAALNEVS